MKQTKGTCFVEPQLNRQPAGIIDGIHSQPKEFKACHISLRSRPRSGTPLLCKQFGLDPPTQETKHATISSRDGLTIEHFAMLREPIAETVGKFSATERRRCMDPELTHKIHVVIGLFTMSCFAASFYYGWQTIFVWLIGLFLVAALLNAVSRRK